MGNSLLERIKAKQQLSPETKKKQAKNSFLESQDAVFQEIIDFETKKLKKEHKMKDILEEFNVEAANSNQPFKLSHVDLVDFMQAKYEYKGNEKRA